MLIRKNASIFLLAVSMILRVKLNMIVLLKKIEPDKARTLAAEETVELMHQIKKATKLKRSIGPSLLNSGDNQLATYVTITLLNMEEFFKLFLTC